jgi:hypothetical protein
MTSASVVTRKSEQAVDQSRSVVTPQRFGQGMRSFEEWMNAIEQNKENFQRHYDEFQPADGDVERLREFVQAHGVKALVLGEDWCPDVWRGLPVIAKIAERAGMEARFLLRDQNKDIMSEFLNKGEFESIPTIVFYDREHRYLGHWIERADFANEQMAGIRSILAGKERGTPEYDEARAEYTRKTWESAEGWRQAQVKEHLALLEEALG